MLVDRRRGLIQPLHPKQRRYYITKHLYYVCVEFGRKKLPSLKIFGKLLLDILFEMGMNDIKIDRCVWYELTVALPMLLQKMGLLDLSWIWRFIPPIILEKEFLLWVFLRKRKRGWWWPIYIKSYQIQWFFLIKYYDFFLLNFNFSSQ